jgi:hypothetical protein
MNKIWRILTALLVFAMLFGATASAASADSHTGECEEFYLRAVHGINGELLGLPSELPVDVYVNGGYAFTFEYRQAVTAKLPAGEYTVTVNLAGTDTQVMSLGPVEIPGCAKVVAKASLVDGVPTLRVVKLKIIDPIHF